MMVIGGVPRNLRGWKRDQPDHRDRVYRVPAVVLPSASDVAALCSPVEEQGSLGSCTAHAATAAMEFLYRKLGTAASPELSRLFVYYYTRVFIDKTPATEDNGVSLRSVMKALRTFGVCFEKTWPYLPERFSVAPSNEAVLEAFQHRIIQYSSVMGLLGIKACLAEGYPPLGGISLPESVLSESCQHSGLIQLPNKNESILGGHAVLFVGYDDSKELLTFKNSWGVSWGNKGYGYLPYTFASAGLIKDVWTIRQEEM